MQQTLKRRFSHSILVLLVALPALTFPGFLRAQSEAPPASQFPAEWSEAVKTLAEKISSSVGRARSISLDLENISSLSTSDAARIRESLEADLKQRQFTIGEQQAAKARVTLTLSEGVEGFVWVAQVRGEGGEQTAMVSVSKGSEIKESSGNGVLALGKKLVWQQPGKFLDFLTDIDPVGLSSTLVVLEPERLEYYRSAKAVDWEHWRSVALPRANTARDLQGTIDEPNAHLPSLRCIAVLDPEKSPMR